jgi:hypothetical protein
VVGEAATPPGPDFACDDSEEAGHDDFLDIESFYPDPRVIGRNREGTRSRPGMMRGRWSRRTTPWTIPGTEPRSTRSESWEPRRPYTRAELRPRRTWHPPQPPLAQSGL